MRRSIDIALAALIPLLIIIYLLLAPYTKVEESFNTQATHDILTYGLPLKSDGFKLREPYDHLEFPGSVPRTFVGPLALATASWPFLGLVRGFHRQILVRAILGLFNAFCILSFRNGVAKTYGRNTANWFVILQASQFHMMYYVSRPLPNFFALGLTTLAIRDLLPYSTASRSSIHPQHRYKRALTTLTIVGIIFRSEIAVLLATHTIYLLLQRRGLHPINDIFPAGLFGALVGLTLTVPIDSYFWQQPLWPELQSFIFNVLHGQSSSWGILPWHFYFTSALPRLLFNPLNYYFCIPLTLAIPALRGPSLDILIPNLAFVAIYGAQPHKEWRFIVYVIPPLLAVAAAGASWIWTRRAKTLAYRMLTYAIVASTMASFLASSAMLAVSRLNYPGAEALNRLHAIVNEQKELPSTVNVHMDTLSCMTGVTRFLQQPAPPDNHSATVWSYDKTEDPAVLRSPSFWNEFDYALTESPESIPGNWTTVATISGFAGVKLLRLGNDADGMREQLGSLSTRQLMRSWWADVRNLGVLHSTGRTWNFAEVLGRKFTRGYWVRPRMEEKLWVVRREGEGAKVGGGGGG